MVYRTLVILTLCVSGASAALGQTAEDDAQDTRPVEEGEVYSLAELQMQLPLPQGWNVVSRAEMSRVTDVVISRRVLGSENQRAAKGTVKNHLLIADLRPERAQPVVAMLGITSIEIDAEGGFTNALKYEKYTLKHMQDVLGDRLRILTAPRLVQLDAKEFAAFECLVDEEGYTVYLAYYYRFENGRMFQIDASGTSRDALRDAQESLKRVRFHETSKVE